ncbi:FAD-dependent oxidoreductase [Clostridium ganghwense]|uniref:FAD-dependent oxidoreductase n=2 Tax=Clostridium ganghwense TaxID=312089 RepID=A0ABT4CT62_9CLOT|nr:FAD-dependent oxidoreductase [Clostridium ganghwense]
MTKEIPIIKEIDVVVVGGGPAGVAAAVTSAEQGMKTLIIERYGFFGGANVAGFSATIGGLYSSTENGEVEQIVQGFAGRFTDLLRAKGGLIGPVKFGHTALAPHDPFIWKETADELIKGANVEVLFHTSFVDVIMEDNKIVGVVIENKDGRSAIKGKVFIDATGDGDVAAKAGAPYVYGKDGVIQSTTMTFRMGNVNWDKASKYSLEDIWEKAEEADTTGKYNLPRKHPFIFPAPRKEQAIMNATSIIATDNRVLYPTKTEDLTYCEFAGREQIREYEKFVKDYIPGFENAYIIDNAPQIGIRQSRTIEGEYTLTNEDVVNARKFDTAIARSAWPIEIHGGADGVKVVNLDDDYYEIPFEVMLPKNVEGIMTAGRCVSCEHEALASARVVAQCFEEGSAAGFAAALAIKEGIMPKQVDVKKVRECMIKNGSILY